MKISSQRGLIFLFILLLSINHCQAQLDCKEHFGPTGYGLTSVHVFNERTIIAAGAAAEIIKSYDGGISWKQISSASTRFYIFPALDFPSDSVGYALAPENTILKTEDQGENWFPVYPGTSAAIYDICFLNKTTGFAIGENVFLKTTDGGMNWKANGISLLRNNHVNFINDSTGFITGTSGPLRTIDTGRTWVNIDLSSLPFGTNITKVFFVNTNVGYGITSNGYIVKTSNGGITWDVLRYDDYALDIYFINENAGFVTVGGNNSKILKTTDGGITWETDSSIGQVGSLFGIGGDDAAKKLVITGSQPSGALGSGRYILTSNDKGKTWKKESCNTNINYFAAECLNDSTCYIAGEYGNIYKTKDYGVSWKGFDFNSPNSISSLFFLDARKGFVATNKDLLNGDELYQTLDSGKIWTRNTYPDTLINSNSVIKKIFFWDSLRGVIVDQVSCYKTTDGGKSWVRKFSHSDYESSIDAAFTKSGKGMMISTGGKLSLSTNYGETWVGKELNNTNEFFFGCYFFDDSLGFIGGNDGLVYKTTDAGSNWEKINTGSFLVAKSFLFKDKSNGFAVGSQNGSAGSLYQTTDGGNNWGQVFPAGDRYNVIAGHGSRIYVAGEYGELLTLTRDKKLLISGYISGNQTVCINTRSIFNTGEVPNVTNQWTLSGGGTQSPGMYSDTINWTLPGTYTLSLTTSDECGQASPRSLEITVVEFKPQKITVTDSVLTTGPAKAYQWYRNGTKILTAEGGTSPAIIGRISGIYQVEVTNEAGCKAFSDEVAYIPTTTICPFSNTVFAAYPGILYQWQVNNGSGYTNLQNSNVYSGVTDINLVITGIAADNSGNTYRCLVNNGNIIPGPEYMIRFGNEWVGSKNTAWEDPANWSCGSVPDEYTDVVVGNGAVRSLMVNSNVVCRSLKVLNGFTVTVTTGHSIKVTH